ncbi:MAG: TonB-dependent receptor [Gemmatimonadetes bacterium]|nr:TonB-dependent receptor [Gemmatimonadota bacterium]
MSLARWLRFLVMGLSLCALVPEFVFGQAPTAQISGRVTDTTGAVLPGVDVTVTHTDTGLVRSVVTNESGQYTLPSLPVGPYRLEAALQGFRTFVQAGITLQVNANLVIDATLPLGEISETVTVTSQASIIAVETRSMSVATVVERERILELPLPARNVTNLINLSGAAVTVGASPSWGMATGVNIAVAGGQRFGVAYLLDGAEHTNRFDQTGMPMPFPDSLQEFRVSTSTQEAGTGRATGASVNAVTRSGTNAFHGDLFWFGRNARFNARKADATRDDGLRRNQPGFAIGGPLLLSRVFFFTGYQSTILDQAPSDVLSIVPTQAMLNGDWTAFNQCHRPAWRDAEFASGTVNPARYNSAALRLAARLPQAGNQCGEVRWGDPIERHDKQVVTRLDFQQSARHLVFGRYMGTLHDQVVPFEKDSSNLLSSTSSGFNDRHHSIVAGNTLIFGAAAVNAFRVSYNRLTVRKVGARFFDPQDVGIAQWTSVPGHFVLNVPGAFSLGSGPTAKREMTQNQVQVSNDFTLTRGGHQLNLGGAWGRADVLSLAHTRGVGSLAFSANNTGNALADFMLGRVDNIRQSMPSTLSPYQHYIGLYAQDTWRATSRLTLNLGLRWEPFLPMVWEENPLGGIRVYNFSVEGFKAGRKSVVFPAAPAGFTYPSQNANGSGPADFEGHSGIPRKLNKFAPRVGAAWDPTGQGRTSIRGSYGLSYDVIELQSLLNSNNVSPWAADIIHRNGPLDNPWSGLAGGSPFPFDWRATPLFATGSVFIPFDRDLDMTYVQSWNLALQQQLMNRWLVSVSYLGSKSSRLWNTTAVNPSLILTQASYPGLFTGSNTCVLEGVSYTPCNQTGNINQRRELRLWAAQNDPARLADARLFANIDEYRSDSTANYHGMLTSVRGDIYNVNLNANYTLSKCMSDRVNVGVSNPNQTFQVGRDRGPCLGDRRHIVNLTGVATSPRFNGRAARALASDWRLALIYTWQSAAPLTITSGADRALTGLAGQTADRVDGNLYQDKSGDLGSQYFNRAAFATPALGTYGNTGFFAFRGLANWSLDLALSRVFSVGTHRVEGRVETFNLTNAIRPNDPVTNLSSPNFGRITGVQDPRILQFALKYVF